MKRKGSRRERGQGGNTYASCKNSKLLASCDAALTADGCI